MIEGLWESSGGPLGPVWAKADQVGMVEDEGGEWDSMVAGKMLTVWPILNRNASKEIILAHRIGT